MSKRDPLDEYRDALGLPWKNPPKKARARARTRPSGDPLAPPPADSPVRELRQKDVRSAGLQTPAGGMITRPLPGADVTLMITPPEGDGLWTIQGRIWLDPHSDMAIRVALCQEANVMAEAQVREGGTFRFQDLLLGAWSLEFHLEDGRVLVLRGPEP